MRKTVEIGRNEKKQCKATERATKGGLKMGKEAQEGRGKEREGIR